MKETDWTDMYMTPEEIREEITRDEREDWRRALLSGTETCDEW